MPADRYLSVNTAGVQVEKSALDSSAGAGSAGALVALDALGRLPANMMPAGIGVDSVTCIASEAISAGQLVTFWDNAGVLKAKLADSTTINALGRADAFATAAVALNATGTFYKEGTVTGVSGLTVGGAVYLSAAGGVSSAVVAPGSNATLQFLGIALSATTFDFEPDRPIIRSA
jgi:hypothetical protein